MITASQFKVGDTVAFIEEKQVTIHFSVEHTDDKYAYLKEYGSLSMNHRASLRSSELRVFDQTGWTLVSGHFDRHTPQML